MQQLWFMDVANIWMVPFYPLLAFLTIALGRAFSGAVSKDGVVKGPFANKMLSMGLTVAATFLGLLHAAGAISWLFAQGEHAQVIEKNWHWLTAGNLNLSVGYLLDSMSVMMLFVVTFISLFIQIYTHGYMDHDKGYCKFFAYLALFNFSMLGLVLSTNLFQIYIFWELVGVSSYLLIGFWFTRPAAGAAAIKAFLMNRVGDFGFLIGILGLLFYGFGAWQEYLAQHPEQALLSFQSLKAVAPQVAVAAGTGIFGWICFLVFMGPMAKSAQVPLHTWLPDAMEGPTPISALIHAATMVAAGVYLIGRVYPMVTLSETALSVVAVVGVLTALIGASIALVQTDIKKALAYSTMSQLGYMVAGMGIGAFTGALFHLFTHAFFKALLFLCSGSVIHACEDEQDMRKMGGLFNKLPVTGWTYLIGTVAIAGLPFTSGFFSKDMILDHAAHYDPLVFGVLVFTALLTAFYMFRTFFLTFAGQYRGTAHVHHESPWMSVPLAVLAVPSLLIGFFLSGLGAEAWPAFGHYIHYHFVPAGASAVHEPETLGALLSAPVTLLSTGLVLLGLVLSFFFYNTDAGRQWPDKFRALFPSFTNVFQKKWYFDEFYQGVVDKIYLVFARGSARFDKNGIDGLVNGSGRTVMGVGGALRELQSGRLQTYLVVMFLGVAVLALVMYYWLF